MQFYGENFSHSDGLSRQSMEKALTQLWRYPNLKYQTQLQPKLEGNACGKRYHYYRRSV